VGRAADKRGIHTDAKSSAVSKVYWGVATQTYTGKENDDCSEAFTKECKQKAWGAACHADYISTQLDGVMVEYTDREKAPDRHTVESRNKRKAIQKQRDALLRAMKAIGENVQQGNRAIAELHRSVESNLALAKHAEEWGWAEAQSATEA
jgi:hypothetical protein